MKVSELREKSRVDLNKELLRLKTEQFELRMKSVTGQLKTNHLIRANRKDVARVETVLSELGEE